MGQQDPLTHRYPRTLEQAFGPGVRDLPSDGGRRKNRRAIALYVFTVLASFAAIACSALLLGVRP